MSISLSSTRHRGASLVELVIFIVVVSIAVIGLLGPMKLIGGSSADPLRRKQALMIAEGLMEEVMLARFTHCDAADANVRDAADSTGCATTPEVIGPEAGNARPFDNINDYVTQLDTPQAAFDSGGVLADVNLSPINAPTATDPFTGTLMLSNATLNAVGGGAALKITVAITDTRTGTVTKLEAFRLRYAPNSPP